MVSCESFQSYKVPLKNSEQSVIEHNLVTIYLSLECPDNTNENPNLIIHIFDKKTSPTACKSDASMPSYFQPNQSSLLVNSIHHHHQQQPNFGSSYQQQYHHHYHHSSVLNNEPPTTTTTITTGDHNDVSSTTTTVVFSALQPPPPPPPPPSSSHLPIQQIKSEVKTQPSPIYRRQPTSYSPPMNTSLNPQYLSAQHVIQTPSSNMDSPSNTPMSSTPKTISPTASTNIPSKPTLAHTIDLQQSPVLSSYPLAGSAASSTLKAFLCPCAKPHVAHEHNCPAMNLIKQQSNATLTSQTIVSRPPINRTIAQRAAVASQIRTNRAISMTPTKDQGQTPSTPTLLPFAISNTKVLDSLPNLTTIASQPHPNYPAVKKPIVRQNSIGSINPRPRKRRIMKQISLPNQDPSAFYSQVHLNDSKPHSTFLIKEELTTSPNPTVKLVSPFAIQTTVSNSDIDQTIDDVINGKGDISINDSLPAQTKPPPPPLQQQQQQPSSQLVWVQNGTVTTKTWLSPLYQKQQQQQQQQPVYDPLGSSLTHQDVVNIAQQVVFPTTNEQNQTTTVLQTPITTNSKKRNRSKSTAGITTTTTTPKRVRNRKNTFDRIHSMIPISSQYETSEKAQLTSPITPTLNLINKPIAWSNIPTATPSSSAAASSSAQTSGLTNPPILSKSNQHLSSFEKNDSWQSQCVENVDAMLDEFHLVAIDEQRTNSNHHHHHFDFDLSSDGFPSKPDDRFGSSTPPPPLTIDNQRYTLSSTDKLINPAINHSKLVPADIDVYDHFLNPYSSAMWQENQVSSSVSLPPDYHQINNYPLQHHYHQQQQPPPSLPQQQYYSSQTNDENFDSYNLQSQVRLLFDVQS